MRLILLLLAMVVSASAQTLKWTVPIPEFPEGAQDISTSVIRSDIAGNVIFTSFHRPMGETDFTFRILWLSASGKTLHTDEIPDGGTLRILHVSASTVLIQFEASGVNFLRKYTRKNGSVTFADTDLPANSFPNGSDSELVNKKHFFVVEQSTPSPFSKPIALRRYNIR